MSETEVTCIHCGHGVKNVDGRVFHVGQTDEVPQYTQRLCWQPGCNCENPEPQSGLSSGRAET